MSCIRSPNSPCANGIIFAFMNEFVRAFYQFISILTNDLEFACVNGNY